MNRRIVRNGLFLLLLVTGAGFLFCPRMNDWRQKPVLLPMTKKVVPAQGTDLVQTPVQTVTTSVTPFRSTAVPKTLHNLRVVPAEELKRVDYKAYVYRRYLEESAEDSQNTSVPTNSDSKEWIRKHLADAIVAELERQRADGVE